MKTIDIITGPDKWTQGCAARTKHGQQVRSTDPEACSWCILGAIWKISDSLTSEQEVASSIITIYGDKYGTLIPCIIIKYFNDHPDTTYEMVREVLEHSGV